MSAHYLDEQLEHLNQVNKLLREKVGNVSLRLPGVHMIGSNLDLAMFERVARTCYKSEGHIKEGSDVSLYRKILKNKHGAMLEFLGDILVKFITDRGVTHEVVRARLCSFAQESQRYVNYSGRSCQFIIPWRYSPEDMLRGFNELWSPINGKSLGLEALFIQSCISSAALYNSRIEQGAAPQEARGSLNNECKTEICVKANFREWLHLLGLRMDVAAHPNFRILVCAMFERLAIEYPVIMAELPEDLKDNMKWFKENFIVMNFAQEITIMRGKKNEQNGILKSKDCA